MEDINKKLPKKYGIDVDDQGTDRTKRADVFLRFIDSAKNIKSFQGKSFVEVFSTEGNKREFIENLSEKDFIELLNGLNGILRNKKKGDWGMDGEDVEVASPFGINLYTPPFHEDKPGLLGEILQASQKMNRDGRDLGDIALVLAISINAIHAYGDANGRIGRFVYHLLTEDLSGDSEKEIPHLLSLDGKSRTHVNPSIIQSHVEDIIQQRLTVSGQGDQGRMLRLFRDPTTIGQGFKFRGDVPEEDQELFNSLFKADRKFFYFTANDFSKKDPRRDDYMVKSFDPPLISVNEMAQNMPAEEVAKFIKLYRELKKEYVRILVDSFVNPDKEDYKIDIGGFEKHLVRLKDYFEAAMRGSDQEKS
ncbi:MAG: Fic family protein [Parcubacteria group bacterium]|jgi:hypothetical protein